MLALNKLREEVDLEKSRARSENAGRDKSMEICIRAKNNAWVIARLTGGRELYMALEKANETLLYASDAVEKFSNRYGIPAPNLFWRPHRSPTVPISPHNCQFYAGIAMECSLLIRLS